MTAKIKIGNQTACSSVSLMSPFEYAIASGFDAFEWFPDKKDWGAGFNEGDINKDLRIYIKETAKVKGITLSVHADVTCNPLYQHTHTQLYDGIELARDIGAVLVNIHLHMEQGVEIYFDKLIPFIVKTSELGLKLSIENTPQTTPQNFNSLFNLMRNSSIDTSHVGMCFDVGHANLCYSTTNNYVDYINQLDIALPIIHIHMHENYGEYDNHLAVFTGPSVDNPEGIIQVLKRLKKRKFSGAIILEQWLEDRAILKNSSDRLRNILKEI
jgi:sugar phosphate isomerase/epimerase